MANFTAGDVLDACNIRQMVQTLELAKTPIYKDGFYIGKTDPISKYKLLGDSTWVNAKTYSDVQKLYNGEMGELYQVRWLLNKDVSSGTEAASTASSGVTRYYTYVHGDNSFGVYDFNVLESFYSDIDEKNREFGESPERITPSGSSVHHCTVRRVTTMYGLLEERRRNSLN